MFFQNQEPVKDCKPKGVQLQFGITVKHIAIDIVIDNKGVHLFYDNLGDVS